MKRLCDVIVTPVGRGKLTLVLPQGVTVNCQECRLVDHAEKSSVISE